MITMNVQDLAWLKAQSIYRKGDLANVKALEFGYMPGTDCYAAFISGFEDMANTDAMLNPS